MIGEDELQAAMGAPEGVLLLGSHQVTLEIAGACLGTIADVDVVQREGRAQPWTACAIAAARAASGP